MQQKKITYFIKANKGGLETFDSTDKVIKRLWEILLASDKRKKKNDFIVDMLDLGYPENDYGLYQYMVAKGGTQIGVMRGREPIACDIFSETKFRSNDGYGD